MDQDTLFRLIVAAKYLEIHNLVDLMCKTIADRIKDKSVEELREIFHVQNDFTPEEEEQVRRETKWAHGE
ncbi:hypothetical protein SUGI_0668130 [Cryptomeria japonica]|nr:hypothetical protein SUGI_0668130 [Cryptomeria japonica]